MRTWGRVNGVWQEVSTDANGNNDLVFATEVCQCLQLNLNESPFYADYGLPAHDSIMQQVAPDYYVSLTQQRFSPYFASLVISRTAPDASGDPSYKASIITHQGVVLGGPIPT